MYNMRRDLMNYLVSVWTFDLGTITERYNNAICFTLGDGKRIVFSDGTPFIGE